LTGSLSALIIIFGIFLSSCSDNNVKIHKKDTVSFDLDSIKARGKLIAVTDYNSTSYFIYKGEPMGFHYELLKSFSDYLGVDFEIVTENHLEEAFDMLHTGKADLLAIGLTVNSSRKKEIHTEPIGKTRQVLVQRKPQGWRKMKAADLQKNLIRNYSDLATKTVFVQESSSHAGQLHSLTEETGEPITVLEVPFESEELIQLVQEGEIDYAVCDENVALVNSTYYPDIDVSTALSSVQNLAWGIRKTHSGKLQEELNKWIETIRKTGTYAELYAKYFNNSRSIAIINSNFFSISTGKISPYDDIIKIYSDTIHWDWRLLASLICQESRFDPNVKSWAGAFGLMQIMPRTGKNFGIDITASPRNNIYAGARYINWLHSIFDPKIPDEEERTRFILAAYNAGPGHILDAMKLAEKNGYDPTIWKDNVEDWLQKKSEPRYYNDSIVKNGYFRGKESVAFVSEVLDRFKHYKNIIHEQNTPLSYSPRR
jgi:membrane-bound lytic murein transglycosylase F